MQYEEVKELIAIFEEDKDLTELELTIDNVELRLNRGEVRQLYPAGGCMPPMPPMPPVPSAPSAPFVPDSEEDAPAASSDASKENAQEGNVVKAPIVGTFYQSASPDKPPFVKVGDKVAKGDVICIIEAMKFMNEIQSEYDGTVAEIMVENEEFVEYGQELFRIV